MPRLLLALVLVPTLCRADAPRSESVLLTVGHAGKTRSGIAVDLRMRTHKHRVGGGTVGFYRLTWRGRLRGRLPIDDTHPCAERKTSEGVVQVARVKADSFRVKITFRKGRWTRRIGEENATRHVERYARRHKLTWDASSSSEEHGCVHIVLRQGRRLVLEAAVGGYSGHILSAIRP